LILATTLLLVAQQSPAPWAATPDLAPDALQTELDFVAHDRFQGRRTGQLGAQAMSVYIRSQFMRAGLQPLDGSFLHEFPADPAFLDNDNCFLQIGKKKLAAGYDFLPHPTSPDGVVSAPMVFVGYGLHAPEFGYSDLDGVDLEGKIALIFRWEPGAGDRDHKLNGRRMLAQSTMAAKVKELTKRGAVGVVAVTPPDDRQKPRAVGEPFWPQFSQMYKMLQNPAASSMMGGDDLASSNFGSGDMADMIMTITQNSSPLGAKIPVAYLSPRTMRALFRKVGRDTKEWVAQNAKSMEPESFEIPLEITMACKTMPSKLVARNVVGVLPGTDPELAKEVIVVGAHYDHVGFNEDGEIWNGADDNGSGTVTLLATVRAITALPMKQRPKRTLVFVAFSGEEIGLVGSYHFLVQDLVPVEKIAAMVNTDMVGRSKDHLVYAVGTQSANGLRAVVEQAGKGLDLTVSFDNEEFFDRSDQVGFYYAGIPIVFFNTDEHDDYHKTTDTSDRILYQDMGQIAVLSFRTVRALADLPERLKFIDAYDRLQPVYGQKAQLMIPFPVQWEDRLDY
jgi:hypothetical protein